jgi:hypothetical protein
MQKSSIYRVAQQYLSASEENILNGKRKNKVLSILNTILSKHTKGQFRDDYWAPILSIRTELESLGILYESLPGSGQYEKEDGVDVRKVWKYKVPFLNQNNKPDAVYISITAGGAGPVDAPLQVYDVVAYAT